MWTAIAIVAVVALYIIAIYNGLIAGKNQVKEAWATVDTQLMRRYDLIPNLVETVKQAAKHENETLTAVINARNAAMAANGPDGADAQNKLTETLKSLFAVAENYPELKANQNFLELQRELADTENKIQATRQFYNTVVMRLNNQVEQFPSNLVARTFGITAATPFKAEDSAKAAPQVKF
ncbi:MAG: LemA family protein [Alphaproteobacteria bacterium]|nr:LemA family protein [Alphaproteobacteria bacterium]MBR6685161.1 LemA family protein [Alphaproteobacteria bacterium]